MELRLAKILLLTVGSIGIVLNPVYANNNRLLKEDDKHNLNAGFNYSNHGVGLSIGYDHTIDHKTQITYSISSEFFYYSTSHQVLSDNSHALVTLRYFINELHRSLFLGGGFGYGNMFQHYLGKTNSSIQEVVDENGNSALTSASFIPIILQAGYMIKNQSFNVNFLVEAGKFLRYSENNNLNKIVNSKGRKISKNIWNRSQYRQGLRVVFGWSF